MAKRRAYEDMFIDATIHVVYEKGIENLRTKDIATLAGFSEAAMFRLFPSKEMLLRNTFHYIDKQISDIAAQSAYILHPDNTPFDMAIYATWHKIYRYLIDHPEETMFLIRYRYSSLYTDDVQNRREAFSGGLDRAYAVFERELGRAPGGSWQIFVNSVFEVTLCLVEQIINGRMPDTDETEFSIWSVIMNTMLEGKEKPTTAS